MTLEDFGDGAEDLVSNNHVLAIPVLGTLGHLQLVATLAVLLFAHFVEFYKVLKNGLSAVLCRLGESSACIARPES